MKTLLNAFASIKTTILLLMIFAVVIAVATFIENDYGTETAWALIFRTKWFELLNIVLIVNLIVNIFMFKMFTMKKFPILIFHISFIFILIGSALTRYYGYEGMMSIREGNAENRMLSSDSFVQTTVTTNGKTIHNEDLLFLTKLGKNNFSASYDINGEKLVIKLKELLPSAKKEIIPSDSGTTMMKVTLNTRFGPEEFIVKDKTMTELGVLKIYFNTKVDTRSAYMHIYNKGNKLYFRSNLTLSSISMATQQQKLYQAMREYPFDFKQLYQNNFFQLVPQDYLEKATIKVVEKKSMDTIKTDLSALILDVNYKGQTQEVALFGKGKTFKGYTETLYFNSDKVDLEWGSKIIKLPFKLKLNDFILEKYPGSKSPSSYESQVTLIDTDNNINEKHRIYMNNTLTHQGFTFYQSSYDQDEKGTILSVNNDPGKWPTYVGYFLLIFGLVVNLINPHSRFFKLATTKYVKAIKTTTQACIIFVASFMLFNATQLEAQSNFNKGKNTRAYVNSLTKKELINVITKIDKEHADLFSTILIQSTDGRIQPVDTFAQNVVNKLAGGKKFFNLTTNQMFVGMVTKPKHWQRIELFKVKHPKIKELLGIKQEQKRFSYLDVFTVQGEYKFLDAANEALRKKPSQRGKFEKEILKLDEKINIAYSVFEGLFFRAFPPMEGDRSHWYTPKDVMQQFSPENKNVLIKIVQKNVKGLNKGYDFNNWAIANEAILEMIQYQTKYSSVLPNQDKIDAEVLYNKLDLFERIYPAYLLLGVLLMILIFVKLFSPKMKLENITKLFLVLFIAGFLLHTFNLGLRWYVAGHAPWSNSYEAMLYISWTIMLAGILFAKQSPFALSTTGIFSGITLFVAHLSWLDPQITTLVPVLKSYWLTIHVSVITASYGFLGLSALLGFIALLLYILYTFTKQEESKEQIVLNIKEAVKINELSMTVGLSLLIIGNFLGAIWANESWGRYWGWDPKETWTLVTVLVYAAILHIRYVPKYNNAIYLFSSLSLLAYSTVIMTYFGVNYYLSGLHSYAAGDPVPIPNWVYYTVVIILILIAVAFKNRAIMSNYKIKKSEEKK